MGATGKTFKQTTIFIALGQETSVYGSPEAIPQALRKRLMRSTRGMNSATILIADRGGREEIRKMLEGQPNALEGTLRTAYFQKPQAARGAATAESPRRQLQPLAVTPELAKPRSSQALAADGAGQDGAAPAEVAPGFDWRRPLEYALPAALGIALWFLFTLR